MNRQKLKCPLDRRDIPMILINFPKNEESLTDPVSKLIIENVIKYNISFSNLPRSVKYN